MKHMIIKGMDVDYQKCIWVFHGESNVVDNDDIFEDNFDDVIDNTSEDGIFKMVGDAFDFHESTTSPSAINIEAEAFFKLLEDAGQPLYSGCEEFTKLSFIVEMYHLKCLYGVKDVAFDALVKLFKKALPKDSTLPNSFKKIKTIIKKLELDYKKIDVCPNDCVLFWKDKIKLDNCPICDELRWKTADDGTIIELVNGKKVPKKVLRHFPLIPRLKRLFMSSKTSHLMRWHVDQEKDDKMRHPSDSCAWKEFDVRYPDFARDPRNVRLGLSSDGFNPFGMMSTQYSIWPVVLMTYNLPPWLCMKQPYFILSLLIPGPKGPGNDIDVFLEPLVDELELLWKVGVETYDASKCETFTLHAALMYTINDFPAYGNLSGWPTKGKRACPYCNVDTCCMYLKGSKKQCYMRYRCLLEENHELRQNKKAFDGKVELAPPPRSWTGSELLEQMKDVDVIFGKHPETKKLNQLNKRKRGVEKVPWKKISSFFRLEYWEHHPVRHNLDVMHIEKNVSESIIGTLFGIEGKSKDTTQSRIDLVHLNIRQNLHPQEVSGKKTYLPPASFTLSKKEKEEMLGVLASVRVPDGYAANIKRRFIDGKLYGLKSHDHHILMQQLLPLALRKMQNKDVSRVLIDICNFFKELCSKAATPEDFEKLEKRIVVILCHMERIFLPAFFDVMVHLLVHLPYEAKILGPVFQRWMYPIERYLNTLQSYVRNKSCPEASIANGALAVECLGFCARYLQDVETRENRCSRNDEGHGDDVVKGLSIFSLKCRAMSKRRNYKPDYFVIEQAHSYVLANCEEVQVYAREYYGIICDQYQNTPDIVDDIYRKQFSQWFSVNVSSK
ncbi:uncharacterized protein [Spinacia oleracea]|uniref:DUF4218 domain-containing protein n=1 Tax=Spinacia oleracea TaxID=3562 RepID=A0A9R0HXR2_SPIOL|nr:uncharacterized protein LOC110778729 [Spinacia oleracea]